jgi:hypothetical protein
MLDSAFSVGMLQQYSKGFVLKTRSKYWNDLDAWLPGTNVMIIYVNIFVKKSAFLLKTKLNYAKIGS